MQENLSGRWTFTSASNVQYSVWKEKIQQNTLSSFYIAECQGHDQHWEDKKAGCSGDWFWFVSFGVVSLGMLHLVSRSRALWDLIFPPFYWQPLYTWSVTVAYSVLQSLGSITVFSLMRPGKETVWRTWPYRRFIHYANIGL